MMTIDKMMIGIDKIMMGVVVCWLFFMMGVLIAIGCIIYRDAKEHNLKAGMWTAIAMLIPNFIGLVIYLVVRNDVEKEGKCSACGTKILSDYNICPGCKGVFERMCKKCNNVLKEEVSICPYCGESINMLEIEPTTHKVYKKTKIAKPLGVVLGVFFLSFVLMMGVIVTGAYVESEQMSMVEPNRALMNRETKVGNTYKSSFGFKTGTESKKFKLKEGEDLGLKGYVKVEKGSIEVTIKDEEGKIIYQETYENVEENITFFEKIEGTKKYEAIIVFNKAKGSIEIGSM